MDSLLVRLSPGSVEALQEVLPEGFVVDQVVLVVVILYRRVWKGHKYRLSAFINGTMAQFIAFSLRTQWPRV